MSRFKRFGSLALATTLTVGLLSACGSSDKDETAGDGNKNVTISILQYAPEMSDALHTMTDAYTKEHPNVKFDITIHQDDYFTLLKTRINSGDVPDIFMTGAYNDISTYQDYSYDMTNEPFMKNIVDTAKTGVTLDGKILGFPLVLQAHSFIYNKDLFAQAGITELPKTLSELEAAAQKLKDKGITAFANGYKEWWVLEQTFTQTMAPVGGDYQQLFADINDEKKKVSDIPDAMNIFDLLDITTKYGTAKPLETDFNTQVSLFAQGKAAMMHQGTWAEDAVLKLNPNMKMGFLAGPVGTDAAKAGLMVDSNITYRANKDSNNLQEVLKFFDWMTTSEAGKNFIPVGTKQISTVTGAPFPEAQLANETNEFLKNGVTYPWVKGYWPDGYEQQAGQILQKYLAGSLDRDGAKAELDKTWNKLVDAKK
jgi:raffinose/stachyose/melibiose transport system substrate-binding protein